MSAVERTIRKFNPGTFQSDHEVKEQFVVRNHDLALALEVLRDNIDAPSCQHVLVLAPRGRGKTMLLARVAAELRTNAAYSEKLLPVRFMEESHEVFDIADFWLDALYYLAKECASHTPELARELEGAHGSLASEWRDPWLRDRARATVLDAADRLGKQLVLMVENLQSLCSHTGEDFGWELRETLQMEPGVMLFGTATTRFAALHDAREAFFELFREIALGPLDTEECGRLWQAVTGEQVVHHQARPLEVLTGGSPRLLVLVADFVRHRSFRRLLDELVTLIDDHTEYFRGHLEALPRTERRVYLATISLWRPSSTSEIAARARMGVRITSSMLGRLVDRGALSVQGTARKRRYAATERLYCIYYKLRRERDEAAVVQNLIRFMSLYYNGRRTAKEMRLDLADEVENSPNVLAGMVRALREDFSVGLLAPKAAAVAYDKMIIDQVGQSDPDSQRTVARIMSNKAAMLFHAGNAQGGRIAYDQLVAQFGQSSAPEIRATVAMASFNLGLAMQKSNDLEAAINAYEDVEARCGRLDVVLQHDSAASVSMSETVVQALSNKAGVLILRGKEESAMSIYDDIARYIRDAKASKLRVHMARALVNKGSMQAKLGLWPDAVEKWNQVAREFRNDDGVAVQLEVARALHRMSASHLLRPGGSAESAIKIIDQVVVRFGKRSDLEMRTVLAECLYVKGSALERLGRKPEALDVYRDMETKFGDVVNSSGASVRWESISAQTRILYETGDVDSARQSLRTLCTATDTQSDKNVVNMYVLAVTLAASDLVSPGELADVLAADRQMAATFQPLLVALRRLAGQPVRAPIEVTEVARDIREEIEDLKAVLHDVRAGTAEPSSLNRSLAENLPRLAVRARGLAPEPPEA